MRSSGFERSPSYKGKKFKMRTSDIQKVNKDKYPLNTPNKTHGFKNRENWEEIGFRTIFQ